MNNAPSVLICAPTSQAKAYADSTYFSQLKSLSYPNYDVFLCDNSPTRDYVRKIQQQGFKFSHVQPHSNKEIGEVIAQSHEECRRYAIKHNYDAMVFWESDVVSPTPHVVQRLLNHNLDVVGGIYPIQQGEESCFFIQLKTEHPPQWDHATPHTLDKGSDLFFIDGKVKEVFSIGLGMLLITRRVFTQIPFRFVKGQNLFSDTYFAIDCYSKGIPIYADTELMCKHNNKQWGEAQALEKFA